MQPPSTGAPAAPSTKRVLVVEDEAILAETLRTWLEHAGYDVCGLAARADEALDLALTNCPQLAVMDVRLAGGEDGIASARELERWAATPALFYTGFPEAVKDGCVGIGHLAKPSGEREFLAAVDAAFAVAADVVPLRPPAALRLHGTAGGAAAPQPRRDGTYRALFDHAPHGVALIDAHRRVVAINAAAARLFHLDGAALVGRPLAALPCVDAALDEAVRLALASGRDDVAPRETVALRPDGRPIYARVSGALVRAAGGAAAWMALHVQDLSDLREAERATQCSDQFDPRTGLGTRDLFHYRLDRARARASRMGTPFAVLLIDLDDLYVDYGCEVADAVLVAVADRIDDRRREVDTVARFAGGLFALLLEGATRAGALTVARDVLDLIESPIEVGDATVDATARIGFVHCTCALLGPSAILDRAQAALDRAKRGGGRIFEARP